jgi:hypothetical protein
MHLDKVVPFGREFAEYKLMFSLSEDDLDKRIIGIADGPASFNAEMYARGKNVISVDPIYAFDGLSIQQQFAKVVDSIIEQVKQTPEDWNWSYHRSPEHLRKNRESALRLFLADYGLRPRQAFRSLSQ